jgi:two-component system KDP operon response regulator KdpE
VLIVDDDPALRRVLHKNLAARGYRVALAGTAAAAVDLAVGQPDVIVLDLGLPDMNGLKIISTLRDRCDAPIIVISGREAATRFSALSAGAADYLPKPFGIEMLVARINAIRPRLAAATSEAVISASG